MKNYFIDFYISLFERAYINKDEKNIKNMWNKIKDNTKILNRACEYHKCNFYSNIICYFIINDKTMYNTDYYINLSEKILKNETIARIKIPKSSASFLIELLNNTDLTLTKEQKKFLIFEAEASPYTQKFYKKEKNTPISYHGNGLLDIRYKLLKNKNFSLQEKMNLLLLLYPDDIIKIKIIEELEWEIQRALNITEEDYYNLYILSNSELEKYITSKNKDIYYLNLIKLCKFGKEFIPKEIMKSYKNNEY